MTNAKLIELAFSQYGITEIKGSQDNPEILKYFNELGFDGSKLKDETAWCSAAVNWIAKQAGFQYTGKLNARSWLDTGHEVKTPKLGDVVVFWRGSSPYDFISGTTLKKGHVGFYINEDHSNIYVLGGNQNNQFNIRPYSKARLLGYRRLQQIK